MPEPFEFTRHLQEIISPALSALGFKRKGAQFIRYSADTKEYVWFQRDRYNHLYRSEMRPCRFFLNLNCGRTNSEFNATGLRLINPSARRDPLWWFLLTRDQREQQWPLLNKAQKNELLAIQDSKDWWYSTEDELRAQFTVVLQEISTKGLPYLARVSSCLGNPDFRARFEEAVEIATEWYQQPDEFSRAFRPEAPSTN